jgi:hypothetical protein
MDCRIFPLLRVEPYRNRGGDWRINFSYETDELLFLSTAQAWAMMSLPKIGEVKLADEID